MKKVLTVALGIVAAVSFVSGGTDFSGGKEIAQPTSASCPAWYADDEFNLSVWGTYSFTANDWRDDRYLQDDHAWGGGIDFKYFVHRYFGIGVEGWVVDAQREFVEASGVEVFRARLEHDERAIGSVLGTLTLRYPIPCTRFAPYVFGGGGAIFGGGERERFHSQLHPLPVITTEHLGTRTEPMGQFGGGLEVRFTPHLGWVNEFSWNVVDGRDNNFGMLRSGLNFAF